MSAIFNHYIFQGHPSITKVPIIHVILRVNKEIRKNVQVCSIILDIFRISQVFVFINAEIESGSLNLVFGYSIVCIFGMLFPLRILPTAKDNFDFGTNIKSVPLLILYNYVIEVVIIEKLRDISYSIFLVGLLPYRDSVTLVTFCMVSKLLILVQNDIFVNYILGLFSISDKNRLSNGPFRILLL